MTALTIGGLYEHDGDGTVGHYSWREGRVTLDSLWPSWGAVPSREERDFLRTVDERSPPADQTRAAAILARQIERVRPNE